MSFTYSGDPSSSTRDHARFLLGDTDSATPQLNDAEILFLLSSHGDDPLAAAIDGAEVLSAKYGSIADQRTGDISVTYSKQASGYADLAHRLRARTPVTMWAGGMSVAERDEDAADADLIQPHVTVGFMDNE